MKRILLTFMIAAFVLCFCSCLPQATIPRPVVITAQESPPAQSPAPTASAEQSPTASPAGTPSIQSTAEPSAQDTIDKAMQRDIDLLVKESEAQQGQEANYKNLKKEQWLTVESVTTKEIKFAGKPQVFKGDYTGQFTPNRKYQYFEDASAGGKRYYNVKDNFGVWVTFMYVVEF